MKKFLKNKTAFSLIELSIVILIVGIVVAGVTQSSRLISAFKLNTARSLTQSSPVNSIKDLSLWLETTAEKSFDASIDGGSSATNWYDINPQVTLKATVAAQGTTPIYNTSVINSLPAVTFNATGYYNITMNNIGSNTTKTVFAVVKVTSAAQRNYLYDNYNSAGPTTCAGISQHCFIMESNSTPKTATLYSGTGLTTGSFTINNTYVLTIIENSSSSFFRYNATQTSTTNTGCTVMLSNIRLGRSCDGSGGGVESMIGYIGEFIIFDRVLKNEEYIAVEKYLGKKWGVNL